MILAALKLAAIILLPALFIWLSARFVMACITQPKDFNDE